VCVHQPNELSGNGYTVKWSAGQSTDACMKRKGKNVSMYVTQQGITCTSLGDVEVDDDGLCYWQESRWGVSYNVEGKSWSGSTDSRWSTGPVHTEIELRDSSRGTSVCGSQALCDAHGKEWRNGGNDAIYVSPKEDLKHAAKKELIHRADHLQAKSVRTGAGRTVDCTSFLG
jgi:hypothetical protein